MLRKERMCKPRGPLHAPLCVMLLYVEMLLDYTTITHAQYVESVLLNTFNGWIRSVHN